jgi:hypothetical protein
LKLPVAKLSETIESVESGEKGITRSWARTSYGPVGSFPTLKERVYGDVRTQGLSMARLGSRTVTSTTNLGGQGIGLAQGRNSGPRIVAPTISKQLSGRFPETVIVTESHGAGAGGDTLTVFTVASAGGAIARRARRPIVAAVPEARRRACSNG